jgi:hypothetical protein
MNTKRNKNQSVSYNTRADFIKQVNKRKENRAHVEPFLAAMERATSNPSFSVNDVINQSELPEKAVVQLFAKWIYLHECAGLVEAEQSSVAPKRFKMKQNVTVYHSVPTSDANREFTNNHRADDAKNSYLADYMRLIKDVTSRQGSYSFADLLTINKVTYDIPGDALKLLWDEWKTEMLKMNKISILPSVYDYEIVVSVA